MQVRQENFTGRLILFRLFTAPSMCSISAAISPVIAMRDLLRVALIQRLPRAKTLLPGRAASSDQSPRHQRERPQMAGRGNCRFPSRPGMQPRIAQGNADKQRANLSLCQDGSYEPRIAERNVADQPRLTGRVTAAARTDPMGVADRPVAVGQRCRSNCPEAAIRWRE